MQSGQVFEGDQILSINGSDLRLASYRQAAHIIKNIGSGPMTLKLVSNPDVYDLYKKRMAALQSSVIENHNERTTFQKSGPGICIQALFNYDPTADTIPSKMRKKSFLKYDLIFVVCSCCRTCADVIQDWAT